jgi:Alpha-L-arabinofuranosidase B (ABFB) domain
MAYISLQSTNFPDRFIRHQNFLGEISQIQSDLDRKDATFSIWDGAGFGSRVMLRSTNFPLHVFRHQNFRLKIDEYNPGLILPPELGGPRSETPEELLLSEDASFFLVLGLADLTAVSFRLFNFPDRFIRHRDFYLFVESADSDLARMDATFRLRKPFAAPPPIILH